MKIIPIKCCGVCENNKIQPRLDEDTWDDYCILLSRIVNPNTLDPNCPLRKEKNDFH